VQKEATHLDKVVRDKELKEVDGQKQELEEKSQVFATDMDKVRDERQE